MLNSHSDQHKISFDAHFVTIHHENFTDTLDIFDHSGVISSRVCGSELPVSTIKTAAKVIFVMWNVFSDYDLSLVCTSQCDDAFLECVSTCGSSECFTECNRASVTCTEG